MISSIPQYFSVFGSVVRKSSPVVLFGLVIAGSGIQQVQCQCVDGAKKWAEKLPGHNQAYHHIRRVV